jgi:DNA-binding NarL/FixJ family response regulator
MNSIATKAQNGMEPVALRPGIKTLVVDDSPFMLKILAQILKHAPNFDLVGTATNGCQALRQVSALSPDLVLMDVHMPRLNGLQATQYIKQREHPATVVIISSDTSPVTKAMADKAGADGFLGKERDLRRRLLGALEDLFGPGGTSRAAATGGFIACHATGL